MGRPRAGLAVEYKAVLTELLGKAYVIYSQRIRKLEGEKMGLEGTRYDISDPFGNLKRAAAGLNYSFQTIPHHLNDHFLVPSSIEYHEDRDGGSFYNEHKDRYIHLSSPPKISAFGVLGQFLFDACVPKNV
ncbi:unnamed protein product [Fraxinus pennsylvanica]|uniref:Uncharacterized protein n=1 Tax=Fraxinus pennsylvanica TaxID=56036 RepID=A0AAD1ZXR6_9LAMI|nr:unnamed protein product [Fraxinus pennsylvanica]